MITASIVTYFKKDLSKIRNKLKILEDCIKHLENNENISELLIVDNSPHNYLNYVTKFGRKIQYLHMGGENVGYGRGHNLARKMLMKSDYHIIVNPDIIFSNDNLINNLKKIMDNRKNIAMIQPLIKDPNNGEIQKLCKRNPTFFNQFIRAFLGKFMHKISFLKNYNNWFEMNEIAYRNIEVESEYLSGCFMFVRRENLDNVNWFSEKYFLYLEDADLTRKLTTTGKCIHYPFLSIMHVWDKGSHKKLSLKLTAIKSFFIYSQDWGFKFF